MKIHVNLKNTIYFSRNYGFSNLTHANPINMVSITEKSSSFRFAKALGIVRATNKVIEEVIKNNVIKGDVLTTAKLAGISAAKNTYNLIPLCHQINITTCKIDIDIKSNDFIINSYVEANAKTGVEMEAIVACSITACTIYDMCKSIDKNISIDKIYLKEKYGGKSGHFKNSTI